MHFNLINKNRKITTCNQLDLKMLGFLLIIPKSLLGHWGLVHTGSQVTWGQSVQSQALRAWKLGLTTSHGIPSLKPQVWHNCLHGNTLWRWGLGLVWRVGSSKKLDLTFQHKSRECFCTKQWRSDFNEYKPYFQWFLERLESWGTLPPCGDLGRGTPCEWV